MIEFVQPTHGLKAFNCPRCRVYAKQDWMFMVAASRQDGFGSQYENREFTLSKCNSCSAPTIWLNGAMIFPLESTAERASTDLPDEIRYDFEEARAIANQSPRGAAALLRLCIQKLCRYLGESGQNINADIASLVAKGLPQKVQQALDSVRVIGNEAVHPGSIALKDDLDTVNRLFRLVNFIAQKMITEPREIDQLYTSLPADKLAGIAKRDSGK